MLGISQFAFSDNSAIQSNISKITVGKYKQRCVWQRLAKSGLFEQNLIT